MIAMLTILYGGLIWLLFYKFKVVEPNAKSWTGAALIGITVIGWILLAMNVYQPYSKSSVVSRYVVQIAPQVTGQVTEVPVSPNVPVKKGDVLFQIDPAPFQAQVDGLEAALVQAVQSAEMLDDNLTTAEASVVQAQAGLVNSRQQVTSLQASLDASTATVAETAERATLAKDEYDRVVAAVAEDPGAISETMVDAKRQTYLAMEEALLVARAQQVGAQAAVDSTMNGQNTVVVQAEAQLREARAAESKAQLAVDSVIKGENTAVAQTRAQLQQAKLNLSYTTVVAPADGFVTNLQLRPGFVARAGTPVMTFIDMSERYVVAPLTQNVVRHVKSGDAAEIALKLYPGRILKGSVDSVIWASGEGQSDPSGSLPDISSVQAGTELAVRVKFDDLPSDFELPVGAGGAVAIYTEGGKPLRIIRKIVIRMTTWFNYF